MLGVISRKALTAPTAILDIFLCRALFLFVRVEALLKGLELT